MKRMLRLLMITALTSAMAMPLWGQVKDPKYMSPEEAQSFMEKMQRRLSKALQKQNRLAKTAQGEHDERRIAILSGNQITTVIYNYGSIARPGLITGTTDLVWPKGANALGYGYEFGPLVAAEVIDAQGDAVHIVDDGFILEADGDYAPGTDRKRGWLPRIGFADPTQEELATFSSPDANNDGKPDSWSEAWYNPVLGRYVWPAFLGDDATTPDEEAYWVMDDFTNDEFEYYPFPSDSALRGLGLTMQCRAFQFNNPLAEDIIFLVYTVTNVSEKDLDQVYFGMFGDPHVGGGADYADDYAGFISPFDQSIDINARNMLYAYDDDRRGQGGIATGYFGYKFLESPSIDDDGLDNDGDLLVDESPFNDAGALVFGPIGIYGEPKLHWSGDEDGDWNPEIDDVGADGIAGTGDFGEGNGQPDQGEINFGFKDIAESDQIGLTSFNALIFGGENRPKNDELMWAKITSRLGDTTQVIQQDADNVFIYGSGPFELKRGDSQRFSIALLMGEDLQDLIQNAIISQQVFEADYQFAKPPDKPRLTAVPGDKKVTLYWDTKSELSYDPFVARGHPDSLEKGFDFEGYKIYRSEDFSFDDTKTITDQAGIRFLSTPLRNERGAPAQWDLINEYSGYSSIPYIGRGVRYFLGNNSGLLHTYVDSSNVVNGKRYFYSVVAYDHGDATLQIPPTETQRTIKQDPVSGEFTFDVNTAVIFPGPPAAGFVGPKVDGNIANKAERTIGNATGDVFVEFLNPLKVIDGKTYEVHFDSNAARTGIAYSVADLQPRTVSFVARDTNFVDILFENLIESTVSVRDANGNTVDPSRYILNFGHGRIRGRNSGDLQNGATYSMTFQYYPVYLSEALALQDYNPVFDGIKVFTRDEEAALDPVNSGFKVSVNGTNLIPSVAMSTVGTKGPPWPSDFEIHFSAYDTLANGKFVAPGDTSIIGGANAAVAPFKIFDTSTSQQVDFIINEPSRTRNKRWDYSEKIHLLRPEHTAINQTTYEVLFTTPVDTIRIDTTIVRIDPSTGQQVSIDTVIVRLKAQAPKYPGNGDIFLFFSRKPFDAGDRYKFTARAVVFDTDMAKSALDNVYVVPNPYVAFSGGEVTSPRAGVRDQRRLEFRNLPQRCTIRIFTLTGELVDTITKDDNNSFVAWNLLSFESQAIAYGIYLYHVEAPNIGEKLGRFAVIK